MDKSELKPVKPSVTRQVEVLEEDRFIRYYDVNGTLRDIGTLVTEKFEGENFSKHGIRGSQYRDDLDLGIKKGASNVISPHRYQDALNEAGIKPQKVYQNRGTVTIVAEKLDVPAIDDLITWDQTIWNKVWMTPKDRDKLAVGQMIPSVIAKITPSRGLDLKQGFFRVVCTNGMTEDFINLPSIKMSNNAFEPAELTNSLSKAVWTSKSLVGKTVAKTPEAITSLINYFERVIHEEVDNSLIPIALQKSMGTLAKLPKWHIDLLMAQLYSMRDNKDGNYHQLDFLNVTTNAVSMQEVMNRRNTSEDPRPVENMFQKAGSLSISLSEVANVFDFMNLN